MMFQKLALIFMLSTVIYVSHSKAYSMTCPALFSASESMQFEKTSPIITQMIRNPSLREVILEKKGNQRALDYPAPEYQPVVDRIKLEANQIPERLKNVKGHIIGKGLLLSSLELFRGDIKRAEQNLTYSSVIQLSFQFAWLMRATVNLEKQIEKYYNYTVHRPGVISQWRLKQKSIADVVRISKDADILFVPTFEDLDIADLNRLWANRIMPIGLSVNGIKYDGIFADPHAFATHDAGHALGFIAARYGYQNFYNLSNIPQQDQMRNKYRITKGSNIINAELSALRDTQNFLYSKLDQYPLIDGIIEFNGGRTSRAEIEVILFELHHERNFLPFNLNFETVNYGAKALRKTFSNSTDGDGNKRLDNIYRNDSDVPLIANAKKHTSSKSKATAFEWIVYHWRTSGVNPIE